MKRFTFLTALLASVLLSAAEMMKWDSSNNFGEWGSPNRMTLERKDGVLAMKVTGKDPCFTLKNIEFDPKAYNVFAFEYRVPEKIASENTGRIYFQREGEQGFSGVNINLGSYLSDGEWHRKEVRLDTTSISPFHYWEQAKSITRLRFDPVEEDGSLEIRSMEFLKLDSVMKWDFSNNFGDWGRPTRMTMERKNGTLVMSSNGKDPCFQIDNLFMTPMAYNLFVMEYRVPGKIESGNQGKINFLRNEDKNFTGVYINLGSYICDGEWHKKEIPLTPGNISPFKYWENATGIRKLRFDPFENQGALEIRSMEFIKDEKRAEAAAAAQKKNLKIEPEELLEKSPDGLVFTGINGNYKLSKENSVDGKYCMEQGGDSNEEYVAQSQTVFPVKPDTRYVLRFYSRNTVPVGHVLFRFIQSRKSDELIVSSYLDSGWTQLSCNMDKWTLSEKEFSTFKNTYGIAIAFHVKNNGVGKAWWDKFELQEIREAIPALTIAPNSLFDTFTDMKTEEAYQYNVEGKKAKQVAWREIEEKDNPLIVHCNCLVAASAKVKVTLERAGKVYVTDSRNAEEKVSFPLPVLNLPEGKYLLTATAEENGNVLCKAETFVYRHASVKQEILPLVKRVAAQPGKKGLFINGKPFLRINLSGFPYVFMTPDVTEFPNASEMIALAKKHFGINTMGVISYGKAPDYEKLPREEYLEQAVKFYTESYLKQLDFCKENNMYANVSLHMGTGIAKNGVPDAELTAKVYANICHHPAIYEYWYDEPEPRRCLPSAIKELYEAVKKVDENHPVRFNLCVRQTFKDYLKYTDVASCDFYPFPHSDLSYWQVYNLELMRVRPDAPLETYLQTFQFGTTEFPTHDNMYGSFVTSFIDGARSVKYFSYFSHGLQTLTTHPYAQSTVRLITNHAMKLAPFLFEAEEVKLDMKTSSDVLYKYYTNGKECCLMAVNLSSKNQEVLPLNLPGKGEITDFFDSAWKYGQGSKVTLQPCGSVVLSVK